MVECAESNTVAPPLPPRPTRTNNSQSPLAELDRVQWYNSSFRVVDTNNNYFLSQNDAKKLVAVDDDSIIDGSHRQLLHLWIHRYPIEKNYKIVVGGMMTVKLWKWYPKPPLPRLDDVVVGHRQDKIDRNLGHRIVLFERRQGHRNDNK